MTTNLDLITQKYSEGNLPRLEAERQLMSACGFRSLEAHEYLNKIDKTLRAASQPQAAIRPTSTLPYDALPISYFMEEQITTCYCGHVQHHFRLYKEVRKDNGIVTTPLGKSEMVYDHATIRHRTFHNGTPACSTCFTTTFKRHPAPPPPPPAHAVFHTFKASKPPKAAAEPVFNLKNLGLD